MPDPFPDNDFGIKERRRLIDTYIANAGGFDSLKGMLLTYDLPIVMNVCPELGLDLPSPSLALYRRLVGDRAWGYEFPVADLNHCEVSREIQDGGNWIRIVIECSGTVNGVLRKLRQTILHTTAATTISEWEEV
jgi:hypothetical protein